MAAAAVGADKKGGKRRLAPAVMLGLLGASLLGACAPLEPQTVEPIVEQANTTEAGATIPSYAELVAEAMGGGFDPDSLEPGKAAALEQLRQTFFVRQYDTDGDRQLDGPILSELGENTVQWAVDGVTPYLAGEEINKVYGGGTDTALLVSGFRLGEPLVVSVAGANAELAKQGVPANGAHLVVMSPAQAVVTDERSNPVAEVGADGVWRAMEVVATEVPTETPVPTAEPTATPMIELGATRVNSETQITEVYVGDGAYAPTPLESEFFDPAHLIIEDNQVHYRSDGLTVVWSGNENRWVFPEQFPYEVDKVIPISLMGGKIEINDYSEAMRASQQIVLNIVNSEFNREFRARVYGSEELLTWDDLAVTNEQGEVRYVVKLQDLATGEKAWPEMGRVTAEMKPIHSNLGDTFDNGEVITELDVSSPLWLVAGWKEWQSGVGAFFDTNTTGPQSVSPVYWAGFAIRFTSDSRLIVAAYSKEFFNSRYSQASILGGSDGRSVDESLVEAYFASIIKTLEIVDDGYRSLTAIPFDGKKDYGNDVRFSGATKEDVHEYVSDALFKPTE